jgi:hypothetical protein
METAAGVNRVPFVLVVGLLDAQARTKDDDEDE